MIQPMRVALSVFLSASLWAMACDQKATGQPPILARVGDTTLTLAELEAKLAVHAKSPFMAARYSQPKHRRALLDEMIREVALAQEARRRGYDKDPLVMREMVNRMFQGEIDDKAANEAITESEIEKFYNEHSADYSRPDRVQVAQILVQGEAKAQAVAKEAKRLKPTDLEGFKKLVVKYSEDPTTREKGGDLGFIERGSKQVPSALVDAAFALPAVGSISDPIPSQHGFVILQLQYIQPGVKPTPAMFEVIRTSVKNRIIQERNQRRRSQMTEEILKQTKIDVLEENLEKADLK